MENKMTQQEIEAFAFQYYNIKCLKLDAWSDLKNIKQYCFILDNWSGTKIEHIELRSIDSLTDEECQKEGWADAEDFLGNYYDNCISLELSDYDWLRSIEIAVPFRNYSVEEMIEQGILRLK